MTGERGTAVVTGAAKGLGAAFASRLVADGWRVVGVDVDPEPCSYGGEPVRLLDVSDAAAVRACADEVQPDLWVNNAGILGPGDAATQPDDLVERVVRVNLLGVMNGTRAAVEVMRRRDGGRGRGTVINVGSLASWVPVPGECVYAATKAGVLSFTMGLSGELRRAGVTGVRLHVVCPDGMLTPMIQETLDDPAIALSFSGVRMVTPEEVVDRALSVLARPRAIVSIPRWRGAQVRLIGTVPGAAMRLLPLFERMGRANQDRQRRSRHRPHPVTPPTAQERV